MFISRAIRPKLIKLFEQMDRAYAAASEKSGFLCNGCKDNCCLTRFYHHTLLEYLYIKDGLEGLDPKVLNSVSARARTVLDQMAVMDEDNRPIKVMCPLNEAGRCILYAHRPMICRLHGIAHQLNRPDGQVQTGPGCDDYYQQCGSSIDVRLDRTPIYMEMAGLERQLRLETGYDRKIKMTIAEIVLDTRVK